MTNKIKIMLISDPTKFGLTDVFYGYKHALDQIRVPFEAFPWHHFVDFYPNETCIRILHSKILTKESGFTHAMFIGGLSVPPFILSSLYGIKSVIVGTEDPHTCTPNLDKLHLLDYYFTNEISLADSPKFKNVYYCPTAANPGACAKIPTDKLEDQYKSDILFLGAIYPNRKKMLEAIIPFVKKNNLTFKICGHANYIPKSSPLWPYVTDFRTIPHDETVKYYNGAKVSLNFFRDIGWNPKTNTQKNPHNKSKFAAHSLNPRSYELGLCGAFQLLEDTRKEARTVFSETEVGFFKDEKELVSNLEYYLIGEGKDKRDQMALNAHNKVFSRHTYVHRLLSIMQVLEKPNS